MNANESVISFTNANGDVCLICWSNDDGTYSMGGRLDEKYFDCLCNKLESDGWIARETKELAV